MMSDPQHYWHDLATVALLGTARRPQLPQPPAGALADLVAELPGEDDPAARLLDAAAAATLYVRAGVLPPVLALDPVAPAPDETQSICTPEAADLLAQVFEGQPEALLREWLTRAVAHGVRVPLQFLPALLERARTSPDLQPLVLKVVGERGRWLATFHPGWVFASVSETAVAAQDAAALQAAWDVGTRGERLALLKAVRPERPALARSLIETTWSQEKADDRQALLEALRVGLCSADEPLLETALDDRSKGVRQTAAALLATLPTSRLAQRMTERALALVRYSGGLLAKLSIELPTVCDEAMQRDGISLAPPLGLGERTWWLIAIVARTPPSAWCDAWSRSASTLLETRMPKEWREPMLKAWITATLAFRDQAWAQALVAYGLKNPDAVDVFPLLALIPPVEREILVLTLLKADQKAPQHGLTRQLLEASITPWSPQLARAMLAQVARELAHIQPANAQAFYELRLTLDLLVEAVPPEIADEVDDIIPLALVGHNYWRQIMVLFGERLRLRYRIAEVFQAPEHAL
ncbi:hypothetical protein EYB53_015030 [Candidatus Chloroploca sp. M-50]|uniref:HEAT repeat domain-containing protein n=1 Tax=Candidatus Chloroploca mongolica TaxID=2528176 RepID=A0ABS4DC55_9CHLR|nr:DUF5691 domain-containing protein [Candidatus Chloroploca mongolica]MBP1467026.1 hypothetical protein [Candidatus Chloroploca mongolica]